MWLSDIYASVGPWFRQSLHQYVLEAENSLGSGVLTGHVSQEFALAGPAACCASTISGAHPGESSHLQRVFLVPQMQ